MTCDYDHDRLGQGWNLGIPVKAVILNGHGQKVPKSRVPKSKDIVGGKDNEKLEKHGKLGENLYLCGEKTTQLGYDDICIE